MLVSPLDRHRMLTANQVHPLTWGDGVAIESLGKSCFGHGCVIARWAVIGAAHGTITEQSLP